MKKLRMKTNNTGIKNNEIEIGKLKFSILYPSNNSQMKLAAFLE
ncbi:hypothetical protein [Flavobacterium sp. GSB-24]|nr:hypothetical protein [Flavobacterium sp. GSB-24]